MTYAENILNGFMTRPLMLVCYFSTTLLSLPSTGTQRPMPYSRALLIEVLSSGTGARTSRTSSYQLSVPSRNLKQTWMLPGTTEETSTASEHHQDMYSWEPTTLISSSGWPSPRQKSLPLANLSIKIVLLLSDLTQALVVLLHQPPAMARSS